VTKSGNSNVQTFSPAHDIASTSVLVPTSFGASTGTFTDSSRTVVDGFTDPPATKGNSQGAGSTPINCTYTFSNTFTVSQSGGDLPPGTYTFTGSGSQRDSSRHRSRTKVSSETGFYGVVAIGCDPLDHVDVPSVVWRVRGPADDVRSGRAERV
jgi:hypothetical protein